MVVGGGDERVWWRRGGGHWAYGILCLCSLPAGGCLQMQHYCQAGPACPPTAIRDLICSFSQHKTLTNTTEVGVPSGAPGGMKKPETIQ